MKRFDAWGLGTGRLLGIVVLLLLMPSAASATSANLTMPSMSSQGALDRHQADADAAENTRKRHAVPSNEPLHCHLKSPQALEIGPVQATAGDIPMPPRFWEVLTLFGNSRSQLPKVWPSVPILAPARFILFGNFRS